MPTENKVPSGEPKEPPVEIRKETVDYESYKKSVNEAKNAKERARLIETELNELKAANTTAEEAKLNEQGEFQKLVGIRDSKIADLSSELSTMKQDRDSIKENLADTYKLQAFYDKLPSKISNPEYLSFVDLDSIVIDPETKRIDQESVDNVVAGFIEKHSRLLDEKKFNGLPSDAPKRSTSKYSDSEWRTLSLKDKKENWARRPQL